MTTNSQIVLSVVMLGGSISALLFLLPKARRQHDSFGIICSVLAALTGLFGWLFLGIGTR
ncbi:MAG: hypothetical protein NTV05_00185 [Acidobacteria bacterium]|nr:hypothetical protein [Acidobacteriota bacterium]